MCHVQIGARDPYPNLDFLECVPIGGREVERRTAMGEGGGDGASGCAGHARWQRLVRRQISVDDGGSGPQSRLGLGVLEDFSPPT
jgi:hypothetical protein